MPRHPKRQRRLRWRSPALSQRPCSSQLPLQALSVILNSSEAHRRKFWEISLSGNSFTVRFGRIGTAGQSQTKTFADEARAKREAENLVAEKLKKGYVEQRT